MNINVRRLRANDRGSGISGVDDLYLAAIKAWDGLPDQQIIKRDSDQSATIITPPPTSVADVDPTKQRCSSRTTACGDISRRSCRGVVTECGAHSYFNRVSGHRGAARIRERHIQRGCGADRNGVGYEIGTGDRWICELRKNSQGSERSHSNHCRCNA